MTRRYIRNALVASIVVAVLFTAACGGDAGGSTIDQPRQQVAVVLDLSTSRQPHELQNVVRATNDIVGSLKPGTRFLVFTAHAKGIADTLPKWEKTLPLDEGALGNVTEARQRILEGTAAFFRGSGKVAGTDLLATLRSVSESIREHPERQTRVVIFSDMLQVADRLNFESGLVPTASQYLTEHPSFANDARLNGACVIVVGANTSTTRGDRVRQFWLDIVKSLRGNLSADNYRYDVQDVSSLHC